MISSLERNQFKVGQLLRVGIRNGNGLPITPDDPNLRRIVRIGLQHLVYLFSHLFQNRADLVGLDKNSISPEIGNFIFGVASRLTACIDRDEYIFTNKLPHLKNQIAALSVHREESEVEFARAGQGNSAIMYYLR